MNTPKTGTMSTTYTAAVVVATLRVSYFTAVRPVKDSSKPSIAAIWLPRHESEVMEPGLASPVVSSDTVIELSKQASTDLTRKEHDCRQPRCKNSTGREIPPPSVVREIRHARGRERAFGSAHVACMVSLPGKILEAGITWW